MTITELEMILADTLQIPPDGVSPDLALGQIPQWDSIGHMNLLLALEAHYGLEVSEDTITNLTSLAAIQAYLEKNR